MTIVSYVSSWTQLLLPSLDCWQCWHIWVAGGEWGNNNYSGINQDTTLRLRGGYKLLLAPPPPPPPCTKLHFPHTTLASLRLRQWCEQLLSFVFVTSYCEHPFIGDRKNIGDISVRSWDPRRTEKFWWIYTKKAFVGVLITGDKLIQTSCSQQCSLSSQKWLCWN